MSGRLTLELEPADTLRLAAPFKDGLPGISGDDPVSGQEREPRGAPDLPPLFPLNPDFTLDPDQARGGAWHVDSGEDLL